MNDLLKTVLSGRSIDQVLLDDAIAIKNIGNDSREKTYDPKVEFGYVTAKILPVYKLSKSG